MRSDRVKLAARVTPLAVAVGVLGALGALAACSDAPGSKIDSTPLEGGATLPSTDGSVTDSGSDASADPDGDADAPPRVCSQEDFCHTVVPDAQTLRAGWSDANGIAWAISSEGAILRFDGTTWSVHMRGLGALASIWGSGPTDIWVGTASSLYRGQGASSAAVTFTEVTALPGDPTPISGIWGTGPDDIWATGPGPTPGFRGRVLHYTGPTEGWSLDGASAEPIQYARVWGSATTGVWLTGIRNDSKNIAQLAVRRRAASGSDFVDVALPGDPAYAPDNPYAKLNKVWGVSGSSDDTMWIVGEQAFGKPGYVRGTTDDAGQTYTWTFTTLGDKSFFLPNTVLGLSANDAWVGGDFGRLRHWNGSAWKQAFVTITKYPVVDPFYGIWGRPDGDLWIVGAGIAMRRDLAKSP